KKYVLIFQLISFPAASPTLFTLLISLVVLSLVVKGVYNIAKAATIFFFLIVWMLLLLFYFYNDFEWSRLTPYLFKESAISLTGIGALFNCFLGYEIFLFVFPYINKQT